jgi:hypothetical protein
MSADLTVEVGFLDMKVGAGGPWADVDRTSVRRVRG